MNLPNHKRFRLKYLPVAGLILGLAIVAAAFVNREVRADSLENQPADNSESIIYYDQIGVVPEGASGYSLAASWGRNEVTYSFYNCPTTLDCAQAQQAVRDAMETWDAVSGVALDEADGVGDIRVSWGGGPSGDGGVSDGPGGYLGYTFFPYPWLGDLAGDITFDDSEFWVLTPPESAEQVHFFTVALHEIGHALGLDHTDNPDAIMWPIYVGVRGLHQDDIAGIQALYGPPNESDPGGSQPPPAETPVPVSVTITADTDLRIRGGPSTEFRQVGTLPMGYSALVLGRNAASDWVFIEYGGIHGWVAVWLGTINGDLNVIPVVDNDGSGAPPTDPNPLPDTPSEPGEATATSDVTLRIRSGPDTEYAQIGSLPPNTTVVIQGRNPENTWYLIEYEGVQGWIAAWLATLEGDLNSVPVIVDA
jgi:uncharacterized protein YraI